MGILGDDGPVVAQITLIHVNRKWMISYECPCQVGSNNGFSKKGDGGDIGKEAHLSVASKHCNQTYRPS